MSDRRNVGLDLLKIICCLMVIMIHVTDDHLTSSLSRNGFFDSFEMGVILNSASRAAVPLFLMITGSFLLDNENAYNKSKALKYIGRILKSFVLGTILYTFIEVLIGIFTIGPYELQWGRIIKDLISGPYHFWYLYLIVGVYLITPILREITKKEDILELYLFLSFVFTVALPTLCVFPLFNKLELLINRVHLNFVIGYQFYFLLGYRLGKHEFRIKNHVLNIIIYICSVGMCSFFTIITNKHSGGIDNANCLDYFFITTFFEAICLFSIFNSCSIPKCIEKIIRSVSDATFGIYILHVIFVKDYFGIRIMNWNVFGQFKLFAECLIIFFVCLGIQILWNKIYSNIKSN